jgi:hypothetical protein
MPSEDPGPLRKIRNPGWKADLRRIAAGSASAVAAHFAGGRVASLDELTRVPVARATYGVAHAHGGIRALRAACTCRATDAAAATARRGTLFSMPTLPVTEQAAALEAAATIVGETPSRGLPTDVACMSPPMSSLHEIVGLDSGGCSHLLGERAPRELFQASAARSRAAPCRPARESDEIATASLS